MVKRIWLLLVNHDFHTCIGNKFSVGTSDTDDVEDLKVKVKETMQDELADVRARDLTVWTTTGEMVIDSSTSAQRLREILKDIRVEDDIGDNIENVDAGMLVKDLGLRNRTLLVRLPGTSCVSTPPSTFSDCIRRP